MTKTEAIGDMGRRLGLTQDQMMGELGRRLICVRHPETDEMVWCWVICGGRVENERRREGRESGMRQSEREGIFGSVVGCIKGLFRSVNKAIDRTIEADMQYGGGSGLMDNVNGMGQADVAYMFGQWGK